MKAISLLLLLVTSRALGLASQWTPVPMVNSTILSAGNYGGEGGQQIQCMAIDSGGSTMLMGTDVGGIYRSLNAGAWWAPANPGYSAPGGGSCAIDPNNSNYMLMVGCDSGSTAFGGVYLSSDGGADWSHVLTLTDTNVDLYDNEVAYDKTSLSGGKSVTCFYLPDANASTHVLYRSVNSASSFVTITAGQCCTLGGNIAVSPGGVTVYIQNSAGFFRSTNGGTSFTKAVTNTTMRGLDVCAAATTEVYVTEAGRLLKSTNSGSSFVTISATGLTTGNLGNCKINQTNHNYMAVVINFTTGNDNVQYSSNNGANWATGVEDTSLSIIPANERDGAPLWDSASVTNIWTNTLGDFISKSTNSGVTFSWSNNGYVGLACASITNFNPFNTGDVFIASQDYNSFFTHNSGVSWQYENVSGAGFGGFNYGGYAFDTTNMFCGNTPNGPGSAVTLFVTHNGGVTWGAAAGPATNTGTGNFYNVACPDPGNSAVGFWNQWKTTDTGSTWGLIGGSVQGVFIYDSVSNTLYGLAGTGASGITIVTSTNDGTTWSAAATATAPVIDIAYDHTGANIFATTSSGTLLKWHAGVRTDITANLPADQQSNKIAESVAFDNAHGILYVGNYEGNFGSSYTTNAAVSKSTDGGSTFTNLTIQPGDIGYPGGLGPNCVRVDPSTGNLWAFGAIYGTSILPPPAAPTPTPSAVTARSRSLLGVGY